jgi:23S rRNA-/tRNA-specific pseudouridylate synthase
VVHRLDREASGLLVFAKTEEMQQRLKADWAKNDKLYLVAIHGRLKEPRGVIESHLVEDEDQYMASVKDPEKGRLARTAYAVIRATSVLSLLKVRLLTGRKNQIRVHFAELDHAVVNDPKYGTVPSGGRMALHAKELAFNHPYSGERMAYNTGIPDIFTQLAHGLDEQEWAAAGKLDDFI